MKKISHYCMHLLANGRYTFDKKDAIKCLKLSESAFRLQVFRLNQKKMLKNLGHGLYMIISPEYMHYESLPTHWIVDPVMKNLGNDYYIGLLSAAAIYGATQQQPMIFQVIVNNPTREIHFSRGRLIFYYFKRCKQAFKQQISVPTGYVNISTREQTAIDLIRFMKQCGHLSNVATVVRDLSADIDPHALAQCVRNENQVTILQRLGYIFELLNCKQLVSIVESELNNHRKVRYTYLNPSSKSRKGMKVARWKLMLNDDIEFEE